jgi:hypothetical protein
MLTAPHRASCIGSTTSAVVGRQRIAQRVLAEFPEWRAHSRDEEYNGERYFVVELAALVQSDFADPLRIGCEASLRRRCAWCAASS